MITLNKLGLENSSFLGHLLEDQVIRAIVTELRRANPDVYEHSLRVASFAVDVGETIGLTQSQLTLLGKAGLTHDAGKLDIALALLGKRSRLNQFEKRHVSGHVRKGFLRIQDPMVAAVIAAHHEFQKGPYPRQSRDRRVNPRVTRERRAADPETRRLAQILALADMADALMSPRSYKQALPIKQAQVELSRQFTGDGELLEIVLFKLARRKT